MASPNSSYTDLITTTLEFMGDEIADAVSANNAATAWLKANDGWGTIEGGTKIVEPLAYAANTNGGWYNGFDPLPVAPQEEFTGAEFPWKQIAVPIVSSGLETDVQNVGRQQRFDLTKERIKNARRTMANIVATGLFSDGTGSGGKQLTGLLAMCSATPTTGTYGGINRATATNAFWRNKFTDTGADPSSATILGIMN
ncbi:MAG TPA: phage major capsid protein, partial [Candidatus Polarisedimenticolia bacterium]|nr:phage major capsid protein [Candidatus Polarisedimenticolia bacterium]